jgi:hypothetical protein
MSKYIKQQNIYTPEQDGRRKILSSQYDEVRAKYQSLKSMRATAKYYGVDKRLIQFIVYPERLIALKEWNKKIKHHKKYYDTEKRRDYMRKYRAKKREVFPGIII